MEVIKYGVPNRELFHTLLQFRQGFAELLSREQFSVGNQSGSTRCRWTWYFSCSWISMDFAILVSSIRGRVYENRVMYRIYSFRVRSKASNQARIMFCNSNPCIKSNIRHNVLVRFFSILSLGNSLGGRCRVLLQASECRCSGECVCIPKHFNSLYRGRSFTSGLLLLANWGSIWRNEGFTAFLSNWSIFAISN